MAVVFTASSSSVAQFAAAVGLLATLLASPKTLYLHLVAMPPGIAESVFQPSLERMHFPTLPKRWRLSSETAKPPKHGRTASMASPRKSQAPYKLGRSASFSSDPVFKVPPVPQQPQRRPSFSLNSRPSWAGGASSADCHQPQRPCPNCCQSNVGQNVVVPVAQQRQEWKSRSLVDLQPQRPPRGQHQHSSHQTETASIFSNNLRSNSWRNLSMVGKNDSSGTFFSSERVFFRLNYNEDLQQQQN